MDGSFPLGGAVCATLIALGWDPYSATLAATAAGALAGLATGLLNVKLKIMDLLASILMMIALYSINLRIMGKPNVPLIAEPTLFTLLQPEWLSDYVFRPLLLVFIVIAAKLLLDWFFTTQKGLAIRATGSNPRMARAQGVNTGGMILLGMAISNALVALAGALFAQTQGGADISMGIGTIVIGLAAVIVGEHPALAPADPRDPRGDPRRHRLPLLHRPGAEQRFHRLAGPGPEPGHRGAGHRRPGDSDDEETPARQEGSLTMLSAKNLKITFNPGTPIETRALRGLSLDIPAGQFVTVIGSNGAGKSTFLNAVSGDLPIDSGQILIDDEDVTRKPVWARANRVARVFQDPMAGTCEDLTIEENMALAQRRGTGRGLGRAVQASMRDGFRESLATLGLGLENRLGDRIGLLSGGQRQAVSLLMAALQPSRILLLDEHTAALDPRTADFVLHLTARIVAEKKLTTMMVTHSMRQALDVGERTVMLHQGQVVLDVSGEQRKGLDVPDLLAMFEKVRGEKLADDALLLG